MRFHFTKSNVIPPPPQPAMKSTSGRICMILPHSNRILVVTITTLVVIARALLKVYQVNVLLTVIAALFVVIFHELIHIFSLPLRVLREAEIYVCFDIKHPFTFSVGVPVYKRKSVELWMYIAPVLILSVVISVLCCMSQQQKGTFLLLLIINIGLSCYDIAWFFVKLATIPSDACIYGSDWYKPQ